MDFASCPDGGIGIRAPLKMVSRKGCGFDSHSGHHVGKVKEFWFASLRSATNLYSILGVKTNSRFRILGEENFLIINSTMLLIKTKIDKSNIHGIGLFAAQFIPKGTIVWKFVDDFDLRIEKDKLNDLSKPSREQALKYGYISRRTNKFIIPFDDSRFFNHSDTPNVGVIFTKE